MQVSVLLEAAIIFIFFPANVTRVPKVVCRNKKTGHFRNLEVKSKHSRVHCSVRNPHAVPMIPHTTLNLSGTQTATASH